MLSCVGGTRVQSPASTVSDTAQHLTGEEMGRAGRRVIAVAQGGRDPGFQQRPFSLCLLSSQVVTTHSLPL